MWKVKLDDGVWLANGIGGAGITRLESEAWLLPDIPSAKLQLIKAHRFMPYPRAMVIFEDGQTHQQNPPASDRHTHARSRYR